MRFHSTEIDGMYLIEPQVFKDERGFFLEIFHAERFKEAGINCSFVQDNHSRSTKGVLRGLHYQLTQPQGKLVRVAKGEVFDVGVDIRKGSPTFGKWAGYKISSENKRMLYLPPGLAHGFCVLSDEADFLYKCTDFYSREDERGLAWNDPEINIKWPINNPILSDKDKLNPALDSIELTDYIP